MEFGPDLGQKMVKKVFQSVHFSYAVLKSHYL